jgi:hypothetical protein
MAYCTNCGASVDAAFCPQCGKPTGQAVPAPLPSTPPRRKTGPWVWILVVVLAIALVGGVATVAGGLWVAHKVKEAGVDPDLFRENPGLAISKLINAADPNAEIISTDTGAGTVTLRDRRTGKEVTLSFDQIKKGNFHLEAADENGRHAVVDLGQNAANKLPAEVPIYPGAKVQATFEVDGNGEKGLGAYEYEFLTSDAPSKVLDYYHRRLEDDAMTLALNNHSADGGMIVAEDDAHRRTLRVIVSRDSDGTKINLTAWVKR